MESKTREQDPMIPMNINMNSQPMNNMRGCQYYFQDYQSFQNYPPMGMYSNMHQINGFNYPMEYNNEEPQMNPQPNQENLNTPKNQNGISSLQESQKNKHNIDLLINTVSNLLKEGKITLKYLKEKTEHKSGYSNIINNTNKVNESENMPNKRTNNEKINNIIPIHHENGQCENPLCKYYFSSNKDKISVKIKGLKSSQTKNLCKKCNDSVVNGHYCYYCYAIYGDDMNDYAKWVQCDYCQKWEHIDCELLHGKTYSTLEELTVEKYKCPFCRENKENQKQINNKFQKKLINKKRRGDVFDDQKYKKNQRKDLRNLKSEKCSELLEDIELFESILNSK